MDKYLILDKNNKLSSFNDIDSLISYGESLSNIFMKISNDEMIDIIAYYFVEVESILIRYNDKDMTIYMCNRVTSDRINIIKDIINNTNCNLFIKYNMEMNLGIVKSREIACDYEKKIAGFDLLFK